MAMVGWIRRFKPGTVLGAAALVVALGGVAGASIPGSDGNVSGCYNKKTGLVRVIDAEAGQACTPGENAIRLASTDESGNRLRCPSGSTLFIGVCMGQQSRAPGAHGEATRDCADEAGRLPSEGEMRSYRDQPGVTVSSFEWTDELGDTNSASTFLYAVAGEGGSAVAEASRPLPYRCVTGPLG